MDSHKKYKHVSVNDQVMELIEIDKALKIERKRQKLASQNNFVALSKEYKSNFPSIKNTNYGHKWDNINLSFMATKKIFPMAWYRSKYVSEFIIQKSVNKFPNILNIGFGSGIIEKYINSKISLINWQGLDISQKSVDNMNLLFPEGKFNRVNIEKSEFPNKKFDFILALEILEHISFKNIFSILGKIKDRLTSTGYFICSVPLNEDLGNIIKQQNNPNAHVREYTSDLIKAEILIAGFKIEKIKVLSAFNNNYFIKDFINSIWKIKQANNIILIAKKS